jgi:hypothetical protein
MQKSMKDIIYYQRDKKKKEERMHNFIRVLT